MIKHRSEPAAPKCCTEWLFWVFFPKLPPKNTSAKVL